MMGSKAPKAPDLRPQAEASMEIAQLNQETAREQLEWAKEQWAQTQELIAPVLQNQIDMSVAQQMQADEQYARWKEVFQPAENRFVEKAMSYDTPERRELEAGRAQAQVQQSLDAQRANAQQNLNAYGIDPSQTRSQAIDAIQRTQAALGQAGAGNAARNRVENVGTALLSDTANMGRGLPGQAAASYAGAVNAGSNMVGNQNQSTGQFMPALGNGMGYTNAAMSGIGQSSNIMNSGYQNQLNRYNAGGGALGALGQVGGMALGAYMGGGGTFGLAAGGEVESGVAPIPASVAPSGGRDRELRALEPGEYVISAETVRRKGTDFFDKMEGKDPDTGLPVEQARAVG